VTNTINGFSASLGTGRTPQQSARDTATGTTAPVQPDEVRITGAASLLAGVGQKLREAPAIDSARVARISAALAAGTYIISANSIASGLLQSDQTLAQIGM